MEGRQCFCSSCDTLEAVIKRFAELLNAGESVKQSVIGQRTIDVIRRINAIQRNKTGSVLSVTRLERGPTRCSVCHEPAEFRVYSEVGHWSGEDFLCERHTWGVTFGVTEFELDCVTCAWLEEQDVAIPGSTDADETIH
jgi:hypothetical protein